MRTRRIGFTKRGASRPGHISRLMFDHHFHRADGRGQVDSRGSVIRGHVLSARQSREERGWRTEVWACGANSSEPPASCGSAPRATQPTRGRPAKNWRGSAAPPGHTKTADGARRARPSQRRCRRRPRICSAEHSNETGDESSQTSPTDWRTHRLHVRSPRCVVATVDGPTVSERTDC